MLLPTLKFLHIIAVISWMAGILYLYRLFIYHAESNHSEKSSHDKKTVHELLTVMEMRLYKYITRPAMVVALIAAIGRIYMLPSLLSVPWFWVKTAAGLLLVGSTHYAGRLVVKFREKQPHPTSKALRYLNEVPTVLMIIIVAMVSYRP